MPIKKPTKATIKRVKEKGGYGIKVWVKGIEWKFILVSDKVYLNRFKDTSMGITLKDRREVYLCVLNFSKKLIQHELMHAYFSSCCVDSCLNIDQYDYEEIAATIVEDHLDDIVQTSQEIYKELHPWEKYLHEKVNSNNS